MIAGAVETIDVRLKNKTYPIHIGPGVLAHRDLLAEIIAARDVLVVSDTNVADHYLAPLVEMLAPCRVETLVLAAGEQYKTLETLSQILDCLADHAFHRDAVVIARDYMDDCARNGCWNHCNPTGVAIEPRRKLNLRLFVNFSVHSNLDFRLTL